MKRGVLAIVVATVVLGMIGSAWGKVAGIKGASSTCDKFTIAGAIATASPGDTIFVRPGTYFENLNIPKSLTFEVANFNCTAPKKGSVVIDGSGTPAVKLSGGSSSNVIFRNYTLRNGHDVEGGVIQVGGANLVLLNSTVEAGTADDFGGCIHSYGGSVSLRGSTVVQDCHALSDHGGGVYVFGGHLEMRDQAVIRDCSAEQEGGGAFIGYGTMSMEDDATIRSNQAEGGGGICMWEADLDMFDHAAVGPDNYADHAGGIAVTDHAQSGSTLTMRDDSRVVKNEADGQGGGVGVFAYTWDTLASSTMVMRDRSKVDENKAGTGGGVEVLWGRLELFEEASIEDNRANTGAGTMVRQNSEMWSRGGFIERNIATERGGGIFAHGAQVDLFNCHLTANLAFGGEGGAVWTGDGGHFCLATNDDYCSPSSLAPDEYCSEIRGNLAVNEGGGVYVESGDAIFRRAAVIGNLAANGAAVYVRFGGLMESLHSLFVENHTNDQSGIIHNNGITSLEFTTVAHNHGVGVQVSAGFAVAVHSILYGNIIDWETLSGLSSAIDSLVNSRVGFIGLSGVIGGSPLFTTTARGFYRLSASSPCVNAGPSGSAPQDLDHTPRPQGPASDWGCFERI